MKKILSLLVIFVFILAGCGSTTGDDVIVVGVSADAVSLDTVGSNDVPSALITSHLFSTLTSLDDAGNPIPYLATEWSQDGTVWTFEIRDDALFHDGTKVLASDVAYSINLVTESEKVSYVIDGLVEEVIATSDTTVEIHTPAPTPLIPLYMSHTSCGINSEAHHTVAAVDEDPMGSGPYKLVSWSSGDKIVLERNDEYFGKMAVNSGLEFRIIADANTRTSALAAGDIDVSDAVTASDKEVFEANDNISLITSESYSYEYMGFNFNVDHPTNDVRVRQALAYATDVQSIINAVNVANGEGSVMATGLPITMSLYDAGLDPYPFDLDKAKELLKEAGYEDGFDLYLLTPDAGVRPNIASILQEQFRPLNVTVTVETLEWGSFLEKLDTGVSDAYLLGWSSSVPDPNYALYALFHSSMHGGAGNNSFYTNLEMDALLDAGAIELDEQKRIQIYKDAQAILFEELPHLPFFNKNIMVGIREGVEGVIVLPDSKHDYSQATK